MIRCVGTCLHWTARGHLNVARGARPVPAFLSALLLHDLVVGLHNVLVALRVFLIRTGVSGVGYEVLRFMYPETLPSVLLWE